jgi:hypothetical protein
MALKVAEAGTASRQTDREANTMRIIKKALIETTATPGRPCDPWF